MLDEKLFSLFTAGEKNPATNKFHINPIPAPPPTRMASGGGARGQCKGNLGADDSWKKGIV